MQQPTTSSNNSADQPTPGSRGQGVENSIPPLIIDDAFYDKEMVSLVHRGVVNLRDQAERRDHPQDHTILHHAAKIIEDYHLRVAPLEQPKSGRIAR